MVESSRGVDAARKLAKFLAGRSAGADSGGADAGAGTGARTGAESWLSVVRINTQDMVKTL